MVTSQLSFADFGAQMLSEQLSPAHGAVHSLTPRLTLVTLQLLLVTAQQPCVLDMGPRQIVNANVRRKRVPCCRIDLMTLSDLSANRERYRAKLQEALDIVVQKLSAVPEVRRISVFGSYARGRADLFTDLDVLIIMDSDKSFVERQQRVYELLAVPVDLDALCYTPSEFEAMKGRPFLWRALQDEIVLYEKNAA